MKYTIRIPTRLLPREGVGVGDLVARATKAFGIKSCRGCHKRRDLFNRVGLVGTGSKRQ